jgi:tRNA threonylcarbamoyl adenosine modification protein YeaZ
VNDVLAIDTATDTFALALARDGAIVRSMSQDGARDHSRLLLAAIDELVGGDRTSLGGIVVTLGPGSYAGLRVGIATAQGLGVSLGVPVRGVPTLAAVAAAVGGDAACIHPAGRGEFALQEFHAGVPAGPIAIVAAADLEGRANLVGEGAGRFGGRERTPEERCRAGLLATLPALDEAAADIDAIYLREPSITVSRRAAGAA